MAMIAGKSNNGHKEDDEEEEDLEALRLAVLQTMGKKPISQPPQPTPVFKKHLKNPNLILIVPEGSPAQQTVNQKPVNRQNVFRQPQARPQALKVLPQVKVESTPTTGSVDSSVDEKEEVSTKFSRYEDTESESEDESETEKKESDESSDESEDVLAIGDDDDSLEALMAQMEHEIEVGIDLETTKKEKKKKSSKAKEKEAKVKAEVKPPVSSKPETKTAIVEPTIKVEIDDKKFVNNKNTSERPSPVDISKPTENVVQVKENCISNDDSSLPLRKKSKSPLRQLSVAPLHHVSPKRERPITPPAQSRRSPSPKREKKKSVTPPRNLTRYPRHTSPKRVLSPVNRIERSRSPMKRKSYSPRRSPISRAHSPSRRKSPRKYSPDKRSPIARSPKNFYSGKKSPSPYYKSRERDYVVIRRSRTPIRRKSYSPRHKELSPKYCQRRSLSPWSPGRRSKSPPRYRSRSPVHRRSISPRSRKYVKPRYASPLHNSPKRRSPSLSPMRSPRRRGYSPRRIASPKREIRYRRSSQSPIRRRSPQYKRVSPSYNSKPRQRSISPKKHISPVADKEVRMKTEHKSRTPSLSLSPSPPRDSKELPRRYVTNSPVRPSKVSSENANNQRSRTRRDNSPEMKSNIVDKERKKPTRTSDKEVGKQWERKVDNRRRDRAEKRDKEVKRIKEHNRVNNKKTDEPKEDDSSLKITDNPVFEARRKKFESKAVVEPARKTICLVNNKKTKSNEERIESEETKVREEKQVIENSVQTEADLFSGHDEIDEIDGFLNEDVLDLSAEVWSSDDDLFPKAKNKGAEKPSRKPKQPVKHKTDKVSTKEKVASRKSKASPNIEDTRAVSSKKTPKAESPKKQKIEAEKERDESDLRAELSRRREERLTKAGSLHEKLPARLLQSAFESALGKKKTKEPKSQKIETEVMDKEDASPPPPKERSDGRRVLVLKRPAPVRMQSAHINVTFPKDGGSESESSYSSSSSDEPYAKRKLPVYMRLGTVQHHSGHKRSGGRKVKLRSRRSQV